MEQTIHDSDLLLEHWTVRKEASWFETVLATNWRLSDGNLKSLRLPAPSAWAPWSITMLRRSMLMRLYSVGVMSLVQDGH